MEFTRLAYPILERREWAQAKHTPLDVQNNVQSTLNLRWGLAKCGAAVLGTGLTFQCRVGHRAACAEISHIKLVLISALSSAPSLLSAELDAALDATLDTDLGVAKTSGHGVNYQ